MVKPRISVVIPLYNAASYIAETLDSVFAQTYPNIEVIVVNDGSTDDSELALAPYRERIVYIWQENAGVSVARNTAIRHAGGELIAFLDADDMWTPDKLDVQFFRIQETGAGLVHCNVTYIDDGGSLRPPPIMGFPRAVEGYCFADLFLNGNGLITSTVLLRRECMEGTGQFTVGVSYAEDYELWLKIARHWQFAWCSKPMVLYRLHGSAATARETPEQRRSELQILKRLLEIERYPFEGSEVYELRMRLFHLHRRLAKLYWGGGNGKALLHATRALTLEPRMFCWLSLNARTRARLIWYEARLRQLLDRFVRSGMDRE